MTDFDFFNSMLIYAGNVLHRNITEENVMQSLMEVMYNKYINPVKLDENVLDYNDYKERFLDPDHDFFEIKAYEECRSDWSQKDLEDLKQGKDVLVLVDFNNGDAFNVTYNNNHKCIGSPVNLSCKGSFTLEAMTYYYRQNKYDIENTFSRYNATIRRDNYFYRKSKNCKFKE